MLRNQKGAALLQVLLVTVVLAGMATMLLRSSLSRTTTARQTRRSVASQMLINACQAEVNALWSVKTPEIFTRDLQDCWMYCSIPVECDENDAACNALKSQACDDEATPPTAYRSYTCAPIKVEGTYYQVTATFDITQGRTQQGQCPLRYSIVDGTKTGNVFTPSTTGDVEL